MELLGTVLSASQTLAAALQCSELKEAFSIFGYKTQLDDLKETVKTINAVLGDAETKQELSNQDQIWIQKLTDAVFEADDLFDEFVTLAEQKQLLKDDGRLLEKVTCFFSLSKNPLSLALRMSHDVKDMRKKLENIVKNGQFCFKIAPQPMRRRQEEMTCYYAGEDAEIIGREDDLESIVGKLLASDHQKSNNVSVLSIVGMGGLGKTALAQLVYNDPRIANAFPLRMWTRVADEGPNKLDVKNILSKVLENFVEQGFTKGNVQRQLRNMLDGKKYLLVLDDVWTENRHQWCELVKHLVENNTGSWILVTTRSLSTAAITGGQIHQVSGLSEENAWRLFERMAFRSDQSNYLDEELVKIGKKIVDGRVGVPLAIKVTGSLLYGQDKNTWMKVQEVGLANRDDAIMPVLEMSFHHLESPLKNCFRYCAVFPKNYRIEKEVLLRLWMAQGYIVPLEGQSIESVAEEYFSILLNRCFFQDIGKNIYGEINSCKVHDLMHDVAKKVSGDEICALNIINSDADKKVRHLSIFNLSEFEKNYSSKNSHIRSLLSFYSELHCQFFVDNLIKSFNCLRVLCLSDKKIKHLPNFIGELLHLRYLDLSNNYLMEALPESIAKLYNLQSLILSGCKNLKELPKNLSRLVKLRVLDIEDCCELRWMMLKGKGKGKMTCLHTLKGVYRVGGRGRCDSWKRWLDGLEFVKSLINLKGKFQITMYWPEKNAKNDVKEDNLREGLYLKSLEHLDNFALHFVESGGTTDERIRMNVMEALHPNSNLKRLEVLGYNGEKTPDWLTFLTHLVDLRLVDFKELKYLPCLGNFRVVKSLHLEILPELEYIRIEEDICTSAEMVSLCPSLEELKLINLPKLKGWGRRADLEESGNNSTIDPKPMQLSFSRLKKLWIEGCPEFVCTLLCPSLESLELRGFNEGMQVDCTNTNENSADDAIENPGGIYVPKLRELKVTNGAWLDLMPRKSLQSLQTLYIIDDEMVDIPSCMEYLPTLKSLQIFNRSETLKKKCQEDPLLQHIPSISFP